MSPPEERAPDDVQLHLREVQALLERQKVVEALVRRQSMPQHALVEGLPVEEMLDYALASRITAIQSMTTINPDMSDALVRENRDRYRL